MWTYSSGEERDSGPGGGGAAMLGAMLLAALFVLVMAFVYSLLAAVFAAPVLMGAARTLPGGGRVGYGTAFGAAAIGTLLFIAISAGLLYALPAPISQPVLTQLNHWLSRLLPPALVSGSAWPAMSSQTLHKALMIAVPGLAAFALVLRQADGVFKGALGFVGGMLTAVAALVVGLGCATAIVVVAIERVQSRHIELASAVGAAFYLGVMVLAPHQLGAAAQARSLSGILCARHSMSKRSMYAKQEDDEGGLGRGGADADHSQGAH